MTLAPRAFCLTESPLRGTDNSPSRAGRARNQRPGRAPGRGSRPVIRLDKGRSMKIHRLYSDANGESHFQDVEIDYGEATPSGRFSARLPATGIIFREV